MPNTGRAGDSYFPWTEAKDKFAENRMWKWSWILSLVKQWRKEVASPSLMAGKNRLDKLLLCLSWAHSNLWVPEEVSCDHSPHATRFVVPAAWRASVKIQQSNTNIFPCGAMHDVPSDHLVVSYPCMLATKLINLWSLKDQRCLGPVYVGYDGTSMGSSRGQIPFSQALYHCRWLSTAPCVGGKIN